MFMLVAYTYLIYIQDLKDKDLRTACEYVLVFGVVYPTYYDFTQMYKSGLSDYFSEFGNWFDMIYIISCISNVILQQREYSQAFHVKIVMTIIFLMQIYKTFFFIQIFESYSYIVTMIFNVVADLSVFILFFFIKIFIFSQIISVIGLANPNIHNEPGVRINDFKRFVAFSDRIEDEMERPEMPGEEYAALDSLFLSNIMNVLRISLGDFDFSALGFLSDAEVLLFWAIWFLILLFSNIIFLNFIIAEASASYEKVKDKIDAEVYKSRAKLISEA